MTEACMLRTGFSYRLIYLTYNIVKFDISLIRSLEDDSQSTIVRYLANMIAETGHKLVAEGIETEEMLSKVIQLDFLYGQGYLFGKPVIILTVISIANQYHLHRS